MSLNFNGITSLSSSGNPIPGNPILEWQFLVQPEPPFSSAKREFRLEHREPIGEPARAIL